MKLQDEERKAASSQREVRADAASSLRRLAEKRIQAMTAGAPENISPDEALRLLHELRVHQAELEMQNEELERTQHELGLLKQKYFDLYDLAPVGYLTLSREGLITEANLVVSEFIGVARRRLIKMRLSKFVLPECKNRYYAHLHAARTSLSRQTCEVKMQGPGDEIFWARLETLPVKNDTGWLTGFRVILSDVTERKQADEALRRQRCLLDSVMRTTDVMLGLLDRELNFQWVNESYAKKCGLEPGEIVGKNYFDLHPGAENAEIFQRVLDTVESIFRKDYPFSFPNQSEGGTAYCTWSLAPVREADGKTSGLVLSMRDTTASRVADEALRKSEFRFRQLAENIRDVFWVSTADELLYISPAYEEICGRSAETLRGAPASIVDCLHPEDRKRAIENYFAVYEKRIPSDEEYRIVRPDGAMRWMRVRLFPVWEEGKVVRTVGVGEDVTNLREAEEMLLRERDLAFRLGAAFTREEAMECILEAGLGLDGLDSGGIYLVDGETGALDLVCHHGLSDDFVAHATKLSPTMPQTLFVMRGEPGCWSAPFEMVGFDPVLNQEGLQAILVYPVKSEGKVVASLCLASRTECSVPQNVRVALEVIANHIGGVVSRVALGETVRMQGEMLRETNAALRVLLKQREEDRKELEESILANVNRLIEPYIEKLRKSRLSEDQKLYLEILTTHLNEITSPFIRRSSFIFQGLTPTEIRILDLIRHGKTSKEIAGLLGIAERTVLFHRQSIRRRLGLTQKKLNLQSYLNNLTD